MRSQAQVVVVGGGIAGCSLLYHLVMLGWRDVVLLERDELTSGTTWHSGGNCPIFADHPAIMSLQSYSRQLYRSLGEEAGSPLLYHQAGSLRLAQSKEEMTGYHRISDVAAGVGEALSILDPGQIAAKHPFVRTEGLVGALWDEGDGHVDPSQVTQALAKAAREGGAEIERFCPAQRLSLTDRGQWQVQTPKGMITCDILVNAAGAWANELLAPLGMSLPLATLEHQYHVTASLPELAEGQPPLPHLYDPAGSYYLRQERQGLLFGCYERDCKAVWPGAAPGDFIMGLFAEEPVRVAPHVEAAGVRVPLFADAAVERRVNGPVSYTPDGLPLIGPAFPLPNYFNCCGFSRGIAQAGGAGKALAEWIVEGQPRQDLWLCDPRRFTDFATRGYSRIRAQSTYRNSFASAREKAADSTGRPARSTPLYGLLQQKGAVFSVIAGWEQAAWIAGDGAASNEAIAGECSALSNSAGLLELAGLSKFEVSGAGASAYLNRLAAGKLPEEGKMRPAYFLNPQGRLLSEVTITNLGGEVFYLCGAASAEWHDHQWLLQQLPPDGSVTVENITPHYSTLLVSGPKASDIMQRVSPAAFDQQNFPPLAARRIEIGAASLVAIRLAASGETSWELHLPAEVLLGVYQILMEAGADLGLRDVGLEAYRALRLERGLPTWKVDLTSDHGLQESGLSRYLDLDKGDFIGRSALVGAGVQTSGERLVPLVLEGSEKVAALGTPVFYNDEVVGQVRSAGFGYRLKKSIALAFLRPDAAITGSQLAVRVEGEMIDARVAAKPLYSSAG